MIPPEMIQAWVMKHVVLVALIGVAIAYAGARSFIHYEKKMNAKTIIDPKKLGQIRLEEDLERVFEKEPTFPSPAKDTLEKYQRQLIVIEARLQKLMEEGRNVAREENELDIDYDRKKAELGDTRDRIGIEFTLWKTNKKTVDMMIMQQEQIKKMKEG